MSMTLIYFNKKSFWLNFGYLLPQNICVFIVCCIYVVIETLCIDTFPT